VTLFNFSAQLGSLKIVSWNWNFMQWSVSKHRYFTQHTEYFSHKWETAVRYL